MNCTTENPLSVARYVPPHMRGKALSQVKSASNSQHSICKVSATCERSNNSDDKVRISTHWNQISKKNCPLFHQIIATLPKNRFVAVSSKIRSIPEIPFTDAYEAGNLSCRSFLQRISLNDLRTILRNSGQAITPHQKVHYDHNGQATTRTIADIFEENLSNCLLQEDKGQGKYIFDHIATIQTILIRCPELLLRVILDDTWQKILRVIRAYDENREKNKRPLLTLERMLRLAGSRNFSAKSLNLFVGDVAFDTGYTKEHAKQRHCLSDAVKSYINGKQMRLAKLTFFPVDCTGKDVETIIEDLYSNKSIAHQMQLGMTLASLDLSRPTISDSDYFRYYKFHDFVSYDGNSTLCQVYTSCDLESQSLELIEKRGNKVHLKAEKGSQMYMIGCLTVKSNNEKLFFKNVVTFLENNKLERQKALSAFVDNNRYLFV